MHTFDTHLTLSWSVSRGYETYGYNIARLTDDATGRRYRCMGGGYDMQGTVFADWLTDVYQSRLQALAENSARDDSRGRVTFAGYYGMSQRGGLVHIDGACGLSSVESIARAIGLLVKHETDKRGNVRGILVSDTSATD